MPPSESQPIRIAAVSFLNTLPLIDGLDRLREVALSYSVPSLLLDRLVKGEADLALCSLIDYQRSPVPLVVVPVGVLGCDETTLTVRLYASRKIEDITDVYCDTDSHTSIALMQILLREQYGLQPKLIAYDAREHVAHNRPLDWPEAMLLIGDKVVTDSPPAIRYPHQLDLGAAWREQTGLPFVFAAWMARRDGDPERLSTAAAVLDRQRRHNRERLEGIVHRAAPARGWPSDLAADYVQQRLVYELTEPRRRAIELFFAKAEQHGLLTDRRPLELLALRAETAAG